MELTTQQKAAVFDWLCKKTMVSIRRHGTPDMYFEYLIPGVIAKEKSNEPKAQALYNAYRKDMDNE